MAFYLRDSDEPILIAPIFRLMAQSSAACHLLTCCCTSQAQFANFVRFELNHTGEALRGDTGFASVFGPQNEGHKFTRKCNLTLDTSMAKPTPKPLLRMVEREEYSECLGASVERPV